LCTLMLRCQKLPSDERQRYIGRIFRIILPPFHLTPSMRAIRSSYRVRILYEKTRMAGRQSGEGRMMIDSVVWAQYINVTDQSCTRVGLTRGSGRVGFGSCRNPGILAGRVESRFPWIGVGSRNFDPRGTQTDIQTACTSP